MKWVVAIFAVAGGVLPLAGIALGARRVFSEHRRLGQQLTEIDSLIREPGVSASDWEKRAKKILVPQMNYGRDTYTFEWIRFLILRNAIDDLRWPARVTVAGVLCGTIASVWSLWLT